MPPPLAKWVDDKIERGMEWPAVHALLRQSTDIDKNLYNEFEIPEAFRIKRADVYNRIMKKVRAKSQLDANGFKSLEKWKEKLDKAGYLSFLAQNPVYVSDGSVDYIMFAIFSPWEQEMLKRYGKTVCMGSTHNALFTWTHKQSAGSEEGAEERNDHQDEENKFKPRKKPTGFLHTLIVKNQKTG
ncbi:hypothetical protein BT69DRAFT_1334007 [Atractiella rhizophila]|nr:hypothetical protein BT69DRAFT_1334007 [Atractiella rhizophila]